jgi:2-oxoglutarate ferredoxin oxidoreductase subunit alpha
VRFTGSTHDEHGFLTKDSAKVGRLNEHLRRKIDDHPGELDMADPTFAIGASTAFISYGITTAAMMEAFQAAGERGQLVSTLAVRSLWPVPEKSILEIVQPFPSEPPVRKVVVAEMNNGDLRREVERVVYRWAATNGKVPPEIVGINRVDGELITPAQFLSQIL